MHRIFTKYPDPKTLPCDIWPHASRASTGQALLVWREGATRHTKLVARLIWEICTGEALGPRHVILMTCNDPICVFFGHMQVQTRQQIADKRRKRQVLPDCPASVAKLPLETRIMLTICVSHGIGTTTKLARRFGVTPYQVRTIRDHVKKQHAAHALADAKKAEDDERLRSEDVGRDGQTMLDTDDPVS